MKKVLFLTLLVFTVTLSASAQQKYGYLYSEKVFKSLPEYNSAVSELEAYAKSATDKAEQMTTELKSAYTNYLKVRSSMSESQRTTLESNLVAQEKKANSYESDFFGEDGPMAKRQKELLDPIESKVRSAVSALAKAEGYDMIFDLSNSQSTIYQSESLDLTQKVIDKLK